MNKTYLVLVIIACGLAIGILFMDKKVQPKQLDPESLAIAYNEPSRFLSIDVVADRLVKEDPSIMLIDIRPADQFKAFSIPGSINIPMDSLLAQSSIDLLKIEAMDKVLYSNSDVWSDEAWILCRRMDLPSVFVMQGGVNSWFKNIVQVTEPPVTAPQQAIDLYSLRLAANQYFYGDKTTTSALPAVKPSPKKVQVVKSQPSSGGGC